MYEERKKRINWAKIFLVVIIIFLLLLLAVKIITLIRFNNNPTKYYSKELDSLQSNAKAYFNKGNIPKEIGESDVIYLNQFEEKGIVHELIPMNNDKCSLEESYIRATRLETEYQVKSYIKCDKFEDSKIDYVSLDESKEVTSVTTTTTRETSIPKEETTIITKATDEKTKSVETTKKQVTTKKVITTKKQTTTSNKITIGFNVNGGEQISSVTVNKGSKIKLPTPVRYGYTFVGWYKNNIHYTSDTVFNDNIILVAKWTKN
ncbi:MAG: InlB B-repeat-containing protein [Bacilli bacterium]|nr:InlB B-repeat-containing protein [Bacilli bacterium]